MSKNNSIKVTYWAIPDVTDSMIDLKGIEEFRNELEDNYIAVVHGRKSDACGGGFYALAIEIIANVSMTDIVNWLIAGIVFDILKEGTKALFLRPLLSAYRKLKDKNKEHDVTIDELRIILNDSILIIYNIGNDGIFNNLQSILKKLANHYPKTILCSGEIPYEIHVPIFEDTSTDRSVRFRTLLSVDETIDPIVPDSYYKYCGLYYNLSCQRKVFDMSNDKLLDEDFFTEEIYWATGG